MSALADRATPRIEIEDFCMLIGRLRTEPKGEDFFEPAALLRLLHQDRSQRSVQPRPSPRTRLLQRAVEKRT
jgi:hypothetical protein